MSTRRLQTQVKTVNISLFSFLSWLTVLTEIKYVFLLTALNVLDFNFLASDY